MEALKNVQALVRSSSSWMGINKTHMQSSRHFQFDHLFFGGIADDSRGTDAVRAACKEVGSVSNIIFEMRFNSDVFSPGVMRKTNYLYSQTQNIFRSTKWRCCHLVHSEGISFPQAEREAAKLQERLLKEAASFIITHQIPGFVWRSTAYVLQSAPQRMTWNNRITWICIFVIRWIGASIPTRHPWTELLLNRPFTREASISVILDMWSKPSASQNMWEAWGI